ncbi:intein C-terminal splicing domain protein [Leptospira noguchii str. 2006001870]|nr:intein C-terminal splicing domain protein [Leptospira noguchii str. 2006001870]
MNVLEQKDKENRGTCESDRSGNPAMQHVLLQRLVILRTPNVASLIEAKSAFRESELAPLTSNKLTTNHLKYVSYTKHQNANLLTGQHEVKGGWGGGVNVNIAGAKALPLGEVMQAFVAGLKMSNLSLGMSYNRDAGLGANINTSFKNGLSLGLDYNFKSKDYTANASYDFNKIGGKDWANVNLGISASKSGHASFSASYTNDGNTLVPQAYRSGGATIEFGNDGVIGLSIQGPKGATMGTLNYDTNTHGFQPLALNHNFQNEFNQGMAAHNAAENHQRNQMEILMKEIALGTKMDKPLFTQAEIDAALPRDGKGGIDMDNANPEKLLEKWNAHKEAMSKTPEGLQKWKDEVGRAGERSGIEVKFKDGKSATSSFGKFVTGLMGDVAQSFGFANDGSKMVDKAGVFHLDTCFAPGTKVTRVKNNRISGRFEGLVVSSLDVSVSSQDSSDRITNEPSTNISKTQGSLEPNNNLLVLGENDTSVSQLLNANQLSTNISKSEEDYEYIAIEQIQIGDVVQSWNENTNLFENKRVTQTFVHEVPQLFFLELDGEEEIHVTWNHPFRRKIENTKEGIQPFDLRGVNRDIATHEHVMQPSVGITLEKRDAEGTSQQTLTANNSKSSHLTTKSAQTLTSSLTTQSEWVKVEDLKLRDQVLRSDGSWGTVTGIYYYNTEPTKVYNLEVEDNHTYVVGGDILGIGYVVHNYSKEHEAVFGQIKKLSNDVYKVAKEFAGLEGGTGNEVYQRAVILQQEVKSTNALRESLKTESNALNLEKNKAEAGLELNKRRNSDFLAAIHNPDSNDLPGISDLRKQLRNVDPVKGFTKEQMKTVSSWVNTNGLRMIGIQTGAGMGGSPIKAYIAGTASHITGIEEHGKLTNVIKDTNEKIAQHKIKEDNIGKQMIERSERAKADLVKYVQEKHGNDPRYAEVLVEHGLVKKDAFNQNESKVTYDEKMKALGDKIPAGTKKRLDEFTTKIADIRVKQNQLEAASYTQWNKEHPNEPYKRTPDLERRRNDMISQQKTLEKERATIINREVAPFSKEPELHRLEKLGESNSLNEKQKVELTQLRNEKKTHETQVAALFDKDNAKLHSSLENIDLKNSKPMTVSTTQSRFENETIHKLRSKDNAATKQVAWEGKTYQRNVNNETGEVNFEREYKPGVKEEISVTDSGLHLLCET